MADGSLDGPWVLLLRHRDYPHASVDLSELVRGASENNSVTWAGGFSGRPGLLADLWSALGVTFNGCTPKRAGHFTCVLRSFWRYLDAREAYFAKQGVNERVDRLHQISGETFDSWLNPGPSDAWRQAPRGYGRSLRPIIESALDDASMGPIETSAIGEPRTTPKDTATDAEGLSLIRYLRARAVAILHRWQRADALASEGRDLGSIYELRGREGLNDFSPWTEADAHATYRAYARRLGVQLPTAAGFVAHLGYRGSGPNEIGYWPLNESGPIAWKDLESGLYPTSRDASIIALLCLGRLAWNPSTLLSIDIDNWNAPYDDRHVWVYAPKARSGGAYQHGISETNHLSGVYRMLSSLIERSATIRAWVRQDPGVHSSPSIVIRSPFVGVNLCPGRRVFVADPEGDSTVNNWLRQCIREHNAQPGAIQVRDMTASDFRDVAAALMYRDSRYSMWVAQLLLGHTTQASTIRYVHRHASRQESHRLVMRVTENVLEQARDRGQIDPTLTRARIEGVELSPEALARLDAYRSRRTYGGAVCGAPTDPPGHIDPAHPRDGKTLCAQGHACVARSCPRAMVLPDSLDAIARSVAEMEWRRVRMSAVRWANSSADDDLRALLETLQQWPPADVQKHLDHWRQQLATGKHRPLAFGGLHGHE